jgi:hypothetical protein
MLHQGKVKRGQLNGLVFYAGLALLLVILLDAHRLYGNSVTESVVQVLSVAAFYGFVALGLRLDNGQKPKHKPLA